MNKGLELIEAHFLFALPPEKLAVVVHPQSIVHCLVSYEDGTTLAHLSAPDMRTPIAHALAWPRRIASPSRKLDLAGGGAADVPGAGSRAIPLPRAGARLLEPRRAGAHRAQRGQ